ncbi:MAG TPA: glucose-1-phosphate cytidylyltransferase [Methylomirabilota bacterium]|jgi:glucose-1-phosphate cytidylyltransferase|nr:glucose-1-phosphate cytidylyltransferase [Methylomirabilota bacterium]
MKVVLFCGGLGLRLREYTDDIPKPMVPVGSRPILWHLMKYYAHWGHTEFILCLGYRGDAIKSYFLRYDECLSNDFVLSRGGRDITLYGRDIEDWRITFVDTGLNVNVGQRLRAVAPYLEGEETFLANYADGLTDLPLPEYLRHFQESGKIAALLCVRPTQSFHIVRVDGAGAVADIEHVGRAGLWVNGGFFAFRREIFDHIRDGEELVEQPFRRLIAARELAAFPYGGFWACMDTFKDKKLFDELSATGRAPWEVWRPPSGERPARRTAVPAPPGGGPRAALGAALRIAAR